MIYENKDFNDLKLKYHKQLSLINCYNIDFEKLKENNSNDIIIKSKEYEIKINNKINEFKIILLKDVNIISHFLDYKSYNIVLKCKHDLDYELKARYIRITSDYDCNILLKASNLRSLSLAGKCSYSIKSHFPLLEDIRSSISNTFIKEFDIASHSNLREVVINNTFRFNIDKIINFSLDKDVRFFMNNIYTTSEENQIKFKNKVKFKGEIPIRFETKQSTNNYQF